MPQPSSFLPSIVALFPLLIASIVLTLVRPRLRADVRTGTRFVATVGLTILVQGVHFLEELRSGFFILFPETFGLPPINEAVFVWFNVTWLAIWVVALLGVRAGFVTALFPLWFLGLATVLNLVGHPMLALRSGGYFPGLLSAPLLGMLGIVMIRELVRVTTPEGNAHV